MKLIELIIIFNCKGVNCPLVLEMKVNARKDRDAMNEKIA